MADMSKIDERFSKLKHSIFMGLIATVAAIAFNFSFKIFVANKIPKHELALFFTSVDVFSLVLMILIGFRSSMVVSFARTKDDEKIINIFRFAIVILVLIAWTFALPYLKHKMGVTIHYWYLVAMILSMSTVAYMNNQIAMYRHYNTINKVTFIEPILMWIWFLIAWYVAGTRGMQPLFIATVMSSIGLTMFIYLKKFRVIKEPTFRLVKLDKPMKEFVKNSIISSIEFGSGMILIYLAVMLMLHYFGLNSLGDFQVVAKPVFTYMIMLFVFPIFRFILPELSFLIAQKRFSEVLRIKNWVYKISISVSIFFIIFFVLFADKLVSFLFPEEYAQSYLLLTHLSFFFIFVMLNAFHIAFIKASGAFMIALLIRLFGIAAFILIFYATLEYRYNVVAVILALVWGYTAMFTVSFFVQRNILKKLLNGQ